MAKMNLRKTISHRDEYTYIDSMARKYKIDQSSGVDKDIISMLHGFDDDEVDGNLVQVHCCKRTEFERRKSEWLKTHPSADDMPRYYLSSYETLYESSIEEAVEHLSVNQTEMVEKAVMFSPLYRELDKLSDDDKKIITLKYFQDYSNVEIAAAINRSPSYVCKHLQKIIEEFKRNPVIFEIYKNL